MILLFTDFGHDGPYAGQLRMVLAQRAPQVPVVDLMADAPAWKIKESAYLLAALAERTPQDSVLMAVVDPGVGGERPALAIRSGGRWLVGPGNGLFEPLLRRWGVEACYRILPPPGLTVSASFHGRDLFAPTAAELAQGSLPDWLEPCPPPRVSDWPDDLAAVVYADRYGNLMTGLRASALPQGARLLNLPRCRTFSDLPPGAAFCYENSNGLLEIAVNQGSAQDHFALSVGDVISIS